MQGVAPVTVVAVALATGGGDPGVQVQGLAEALEAAEPGRDVGVQVDQYLILIIQGRGADEDGG